MSNEPPAVEDATELLDRARALAASGGRRLLGITGPPGAGKSTLARRLLAGLGEAARLVEMDGFHLAGVQLERLGRAERKGAPDTFDVAGYVVLLARLRDPSDSVIYAPAFRREIEEPIAAAVAIPREVPLVLTEGNYLLVGDGDWAHVRPFLDDVWYVEADEQTRIERLIARHVEHGRSPEAARAWVLGSDQRNAELVAATRGRADLIVRA